MKKHFKLVLFVVLFACTTLPAWGQASTEGSDFWVTFLQADQDNNNPLKLELTITSRTNCNVTIENPFTTYSQTEKVTAAQSKTIKLYEGDVRAQTARTAMNRDGKVCYAVNSEQIDQCALHVTAKDDAGKPVKISLFASNYKKATFDATNVLPTASLMDEYIVQTYTPSDHGGVDETQGSHFAIIAAEDGVVVDYWPTVATTGHAANTQVTTPTLNKGQVWYVWTGKKDGEAGDLSGTRVIARDGKKIAVFQGCPHTNIPYQIKQRDHIFSQAMPTDYWGSRFVLTASKERKKDIIRVLALYDDTQVFINGELVHTFNFNTTPKQYYEFVIGENGDYAEDGSCYLTTSCPCAVHLFMASQNFDQVSNGDPAMLWVNPIEQRIDQISFATYNSSNGTTQHFTNIVTDKPELMTLDGNSIASEFKRVNGTPDFANYSYAQLSLGTNATSHTLKSDGSTFIAHVYGFTDNESYGYSAGSATVGRQISVNNVSFESGEKAKGYNDAPTFCAEDSLLFDLRDASGSIYRIVLDFGDGTSKDTAKVSSGASEGEPEPFLVSIKHAYPTPGWYDARAIVYGEEFCTQPAFSDTIPIIFRVIKTDTVTGSVAERICINPDSTLADGTKLTAEQVAELLVNGENEIVPVGEPLIGGCYDTVLVNYHPYGLETIEETTTLNLEILPGEESVYCPELKRSLTSSVEDTVITTNEYGCNNYHPYLVKVKACLYMNLENDPKLLSVCEGQTLEVGYKKRGDVENARLIIEPQSVAWLDNTSTNTSTNEAPVPPASEDMTVPNPVIDLAFSWTDGIDDGIIHENPDGSGTLVLPTQTLKPGIYDLTLELTDASEECLNTDTFLTRTITIKYPESVVVQKFVNVLAVLNAQYNGGYEFVGFQWYKNGEILPGETGAVYHTIAPFSVGDTYSVELTDAAGNKLPSCDFEIKTEPGYNTIQEEGEEEPAQKLIQNNRIVIRRDGQTYNIFGQKVR
ncbi:MAG: IgGFc-binding protein [Paludibacteraceae bacterium]|nr:IgGFc-binding protein [Paludibacteraceae bacterium]